MKNTNNFLKIKNEDISQFLAFSDLSKSIAIFLSTDCHVIDLNECAELVYNCKRKAILNKPYFNWCLKNEIPPALLCDEKESILGGLPKNDVETIIKKSERVILWQVIAYIDDMDTPAGIVLIGEDVTKQRYYAAQIERLVNRSKTITGHDIGPRRCLQDYISNVYSYFENIISHMPCYVYWKDSNFVYLGCNELSARLVNLASKKLIIGKTDYDFGWDKKKVDEFRKVDMNIIKTKKPLLDLEETIENETMGPTFLLVNKVPIFDDKNNVIGIVGISIDITERKKAERELIKAKEIAESADKLKTEFIHNMEHDIRTPFAGLIGMTQILDSLETDPNKKQIILDILVCSQELLEYSCGILDFSKIESGAFPVVSEEFNILDLLNSVESIELPAARLKNLNFSIAYPNNIPLRLVGDKYRLKRVLINLLSNSIKFTLHGFVKLIISCQMLNHEDVQISFVVEDSGIGIEKEKLHVLFDKFSRIMPSNEGIYKGHGLGLRIVKRFVDEMNGNINIHSVLGQGTCITCTFPLKIHHMEREMHK